MADEKIETGTGGEKPGGGNKLQPYDSDGKWTKKADGGAAPDGAASSAGQGGSSAKPKLGKLNGWFSSRYKGFQRQNTVAGEKSRYDEYDNLNGYFSITLMNFKKNREARAKHPNTFGDILSDDEDAVLVDTNERVRIHIEDILRDNSAYCTNCDFEFILDVITNGLKNQFAFPDEPYHTGGSADKAARAKASHRMFGTPIGDPSGRDYFDHPEWGERLEKYGCLLDKDPLARIENSAHGYGDVIIEFKPDIRKRTTYCFGDSLGGRCAPQLVGGRLDHGVFADFAPREVTEEEAMGWKTPGNIRNGFDVRYIEAQYHGDVTGSDIANIMMMRSQWSTNDGRKIFAACQQYGITPYTSYLDGFGKKKLGLVTTNGNGDLVVVDNDTGELVLTL
jgi:hypothetical protein